MPHKEGYKMPGNSSQPKASDVSAAEVGAKMGMNDPKHQKEHEKMMKGQKPPMRDAY